ncbi:hypothetical protein KIN20_030657 [Parelaphostrongylus tenuis]|uniref:C2H2-type domain-containing protein n=1 Tax=Parelaphostrongylus tenuis TaxID=148309 RepID=A0AAD5R4J5_PARTN|nr:hypothetical protein KIN20_030657 [Parelaphostrongylus tenuis]
MNDAPENIENGSRKTARTRKSSRNSHAADPKRVSISSDQPSTKRTRTARGTLPIDNDDAHFYPCPVPKCDFSSESRSERNYHLRVDHIKCTYQEVARDLLEKNSWRNSPHKISSDYEVTKTTSSPTTSKGTASHIKMETEIGRISDFTGGASHVSNERMEAMDDYHGDSSDAFSDSGYDLDVEDEAYELSQYKGDDGYSDVKFESDSRSAPHMSRKRGRPRNPPGSEPAEHSKVRVSDPNGKYKCYMPDCDWKGAYRSLRCDHMKWCHKDWVMPPRYILQRITKDGVYIDPKTFVPPFSCPVDGCTWRGSYRASRSQHVRSVHPDYIPERKKAPVGGYVADGKYMCHIPQCSWRGISRSTRASHMRKVHGGFANPSYSTRQVACCDCTATFGSHKAFVNHMISVHRVGGLVHRDFNDIGEYEEWFHSVQDVFSVLYVKRMGLKHGNDYQVFYLYCARSGGFRSKQIPGRDYFPEFTKRRLTHRPTKCGRNCAAFLRVIQWIDGRLTVVGCVEHTGHRMGTALLRLSPNERIVLDEYLYVVDDKVPLDAMLDRIREVEAFTMDGFDVKERNVEDMTRYVMNENELVSLRVLFETSSFFEPDSTFAVNLFEAKEGELSEGISFGIMTSQMRELWASCSTRAVCIEEVNLLISSFDLHLFFVLVFDTNDTPRCACVFISQSGDKIPLFDKLRSISPSPIDTIVTDCSPDWPALLEMYFGNDAYSADFQIAEWHLLSEWATRLDEMVSNRVDRFAIICALRRWIRATEPALFEGIVVDMFEAFREMELNPLAQLIDSQLTDPEFAKRWTPLNRNPLTDHSNPVLEISVRMFRERFLNCELCARLDEYAGLLIERIAEFNALTLSEVYTTSQLEPLRQVTHIYEDIDPSQLLADGTLLSSAQHTAGMIQSANSRNQDRLVFNNKRMKLETEDEMGAYIVVREGDVADEIIEEAEAEELVEETILSDAAGEMNNTNEHVVVIDGTVTGEVVQGGSSSDSKRKERLKHMMQILHEKVECLADDETMDLVETGLSQVVEQLKTPSSNTQHSSLRRSGRTPKPMSQHFS